jgi:phenylalanyl-tRNA synthetase beta chain
MKLLMSWLNEFVQVSHTPQQVASQLTNIGFEVEEIYNSCGIKYVVLGKVLDIQKHPKADRLVVCSVDIGSKQLTIVTGATNLTIGDYVPVAQDGAVLPDGKVIKTGELRGISSQGMLCSPDEIEMQDKYHDDGILVFGNGDNFGSKFGFDLGTDVCTILGLDDYVLDISIPANRSDCHSVYGLAREISVMLDLPLQDLGLDYGTSNINTKSPSVGVDFDCCTRYIGQVVADVQHGATPDIVKSRLKKLGVTVHNSIVDITNYVLLEIGQPMHAFDYSHVVPAMHIRSSKQGDSIHALNDKQYNLLDGDCTVVASGDRVLALAGIIGGKESATTVGTQHVFLESAIFARKDIRTSSRKLGTRTDSSTRYEKGMSWDNADIGMRRALHLIDKYQLGTIGSKCGVDLFKSAPKQQVVRTTVSDICAVLGIKIAPTTVKKTLTKLGFGITNQGGLSVTVPSWRTDIEDYPDLSEELIRFLGYDRLQATSGFCGTRMIGDSGRSHANHNLLRQLLNSYGLFEIVNYSFVDSQDQSKLGLRQELVTIRNPLSQQQDSMRTQLISGMLNTIKYNINHKNRHIAFFELGKVYIPQGDIGVDNLPSEIDTLCFAVAHVDKLTQDQLDFYDLKAIAKHILGNNNIKVQASQQPYVNPYASCDIVVGDSIVGTVGDLHPQVLDQFGIECKVVLAHIFISNVVDSIELIVQAMPISKVSYIERDLSVVVAHDVPVGEMVNLAKATSVYPCDVLLNDVYVGQQIASGCKSVMLKLTLHPDFVLQDKQINECMQAILQALQSKFDAKLRE